MSFIKWLEDIKSVNLFHLNKKAIIMLNLTISRLFCRVYNRMIFQEQRLNFSHNFFFSLLYRIRILHFVMFSNHWYDDNL